MIVRAPEAARLGEVGEAETYEALKAIVWQRVSSAERIRRPAIDALLEFPDREEETRAMLRLMLPTEPLGARVVVERISELAGERGWEELAPALIRRWTKPLAGFEMPAERPEHAALARLFPQRAPEDQVFDFFTGTLVDPDARLLRDPERSRLVAWDLLTALEPDRDQLLERLRLVTVDTNDAVLPVLTAAARELEIVPVNSSELRWLLRFAEERAAWSMARTVVNGLGPDRRAGLALRHMPAIVWAATHEPDWVRMSAEELFSASETVLQSRERFVRSSEIAGRVHNERIEDWRDRLSWGDALLIRTALHAVTDPRIEAATFVLAELDMQDKSTEHGGTINPGASNGFDLVHYPPRATERLGDHRFIASEAMDHESTLSIVHFHMHAQRYKNDSYTGPSAGDLEYAREHQRGCIVFTFLDRDTLNADYFQPNGAIIDLGSLKR